ncbi:unnamed protein product [Caenorhabditis sp. 36 PRJEB53466]|nr:unnamed protein product [Caenorhabditis sp. 36 PRJEB53466]
MQPILSALLLVIALVVTSSGQDTFSVDEFTKNKDTEISVGTEISHQTTTWTASWKVGNETLCTYSKYLKVLVVATPAPATVSPTNGVASCIQQPCDKSTALAPIDCVTAFGDKLAIIENQ